MDKFDCNIIVMFVLGVLNRGDHLDRFDCNIYNDITVKHVHVVTSIKPNLSMWSPLLSQICPCGHLY
jgi:hypothetical protein